MGLQGGEDLRFHNIQIVSNQLTLQVQEYLDSLSPVYSPASAGTHCAYIHGGVYLGS